jgi:hypothetical protein
MSEMWIEVRGGPGPLWVKHDECRLPGGDLAFVNEARLAPPLPDWFEAPPDSKLRQNSDMRSFGFPLIEDRSMQGNADQVVAFYDGVIERGGLARSEWLPMGRWPGFSAESADHHLSIGVYEHRDLVFWTVQFGSASPSRKKVACSLFLPLVGRNDERVTLRHEFKDESIGRPLTRYAIRRRRT